MIDGLIGKKLAMTHIYADGDRWMPVTRLALGPCTVVRVIGEEKEGYQAVQLAFGVKRKLSRPMAGHLKSAKLLRQPLVLREFRGSSGGVGVGEVVNVGQVFSVGDAVAVTGTTKGRGFAGVMKRWGFGGQKGIRGGQSDCRKPGSIGQGTTPGRVHKGKKMAGHMGNRNKTVLNSLVVRVVPESNELWIRGSVPGHYGGLLSVVLSRRAVKSEGPIETQKEEL